MSVLDQRLGSRFRAAAKATAGKASDAKERAQGLAEVVKVDLPEALRMGQAVLSRANANFDEARKLKDDALRFVAKLETIKHKLKGTDDD